MVMIALAAASHPVSESEAFRSSIRAVMRSAGSFSPITPVEATYTSSGAQPSVFAAAPAMAATCPSPTRPVKALALPELTINPRAAPRPSRSRHQSTGAPAVFDWVSTPAITVPGASSASIRSVRPSYFTPAATAPRRTPPMGGMSGKESGASGDLSGGGETVGIRIQGLIKPSYRHDCRPRTTTARPRLRQRGRRERTPVRTDLYFPTRLKWSVWVSRIFFGRERFLAAMLRTPGGRFSQAAQNEGLA